MKETWHMAYTQFDLLAAYLC